VRPRAVADDLIYNSGCTYATPMLLYKTDLGSTIHPEHVDIFHKNSYNAILNFWETQGSQLTLDQITSYDPYLGRITEPSQKSA
jgi:hypothetical protein